MIQYTKIYFGCEFKLDNRYLDIVIKEMTPFLEENGFKPQEDGSYLNDKKAVAVEYSEERQMYLLKMADVEDGKAGEMAEVSAWLFDDSQNAKDAEAVGIDFISTIRDNLGIKRTRSTTAQVELPTASNGVYNISAFTKKVLDIYPQFKDTYKAHIAKYGNFLYLNFFGETLVPQIKSVLTENNKKSVKKLYEMLENGYVQGDKDTVNTIVACLSAACLNDEAVTANAQSMLEADKHFKNALSEFTTALSKNAKLKAALIK